MVSSGAAVSDTVVFEAASEETSVLLSGSFELCAVVKSLSLFVVDTFLTTSVCTTFPSALLSKLTADEVSAVLSVLELLPPHAAKTPAISIA